MTIFKEEILRLLLGELESSSKVHGVWEGGSAANNCQDEYSDIDLYIFGSDSIEDIYDLIEQTLENNFTITHKNIEGDNFIRGLYQRVYFIDNAPKHFLLDIGVFLKESKNVFEELLQIERHGTPVIHFDTLGMIKPKSCDIEQFRNRQRKRLSEIEGFYPVYRTLMMKELDRDHSIDAFAFYYGAMLKPLVELMGMLHRPFQFDFNLRYLYKAFPEKDRKVIENLLYIPTINDLRERVSIVDNLFAETKLRVESLLN